MSKKNRVHLIHRVEQLEKKVEQLEEQKKGDKPKRTPLKKFLDIIAVMKAFEFIYKIIKSWIE